MRFTFLRAAIRERALRTGTNSASSALSRIASSEERKILNRTLIDRVHFSGATAASGEAEREETSYGFLAVLTQACVHLRSGRIPGKGDESIGHQNVCSPFPGMLVRPKLK